MDVKPGYKQTEVGVIPEDWRETTLGACLTHKPSYGINAPALPYSDRLPTYIRITDITEDGYFSKENPVSVRSTAEAKYYLKEGDLVFARTGASVGKSYLYNPTDGQLIFAGFLIRVTPNPKILDSRFLFAYVNSSHYWSWVTQMSMRSGQPGINGNEYSQLTIPLPSLREQRAIAAALSHVDGLIQQAQALIAKKRDLKQATMQELVTGARRLPGFSEEHESKRLAEITDIVGSGPPATDVVGIDIKLGYKQTEGGIIPEDWEIKSFGEISWVNQGLQIAIDKRLKSPSPKSKQYITIQFLNNRKDIEFVDTYSPSVCCSEDDVLMTRTGNTGMVVYGVTGVFHNNFFKINVDTKVLNKDFLVYYLKLNTTQKIILAKAGTSTIPDLNHQDFYSILIPIPPLLEQRAIAAVLSDIDMEIEALGAQRDKHRSLKEGMMQELLTGKTRLVEGG